MEDDIGTAGHRRRDHPADQPRGRPETGPQRVSSTQRRAAEQAAEDEAPSFTEAWMMGRELDGFANSIQDAVTRETPEADPGFEFTDELWSELTNEIPPEDQDIFQSAESEEEAFQIRKRYQNERELESKIGAAGWSGISARLLAGVLDETALAAIVATEGTAAPWIFSAKATRLARTVRAGGAAAGTEAAIQSQISDQRETKGTEDVVFASLMGAAIGAPFGAFMRPIGRPGDEAAGIANDAERLQRVANEMNDHQAVGAIQSVTRVSRGEAETALENLRANQRQLQESERELADARTREQEVTSETPEARVLREEGDGDQPIGSREELQAAFSRRARQSRDEETPDEAVMRLFTPTRKHGIGRKESFKIRERATRRVQQAARDQAHEAAEATTRVRDLETRTQELQDLINGQRSELDSATRASPVDGAEVLTGRPRDSVFEATPEARARRAPTPEQAGARSAGAQENPEFMPMSSADDPVDFSRAPEVSTALDQRPYMARARIDLYGRVANTDSPTGRAVANTLFSNPVAGDSGRRWFGRNVEENFSPHAAAEFKDRLSQVLMVAFYREALPAFNAWGRAKGLNFWQRSLPGQHRTEFFESVTLAVRTQDFSEEHIGVAARAIDKNNRKVLDLAVREGLMGADEIEEVLGYINRVWEPNKISRLTADPQVRGSGVRMLIEESIRRADVDGDISDAARAAMARAVYSRFNAKGHGIQTDFNAGFFSRDIGEVRRVLKEAGTDKEDIETIVGHVARQTQDSASDAGRVRNLKSRIPMDENTEVRLPTGRRLKFSELTENNAERLHINYLNRMTGHISVARHLRPLLDDEAVRHGIKTDYEFNRLTDMARAEGMSSKKIDHMTMGYNLLVGRPPENGTNSALHQVMRFVRDWNFVRLMGQVGFAQVAEFGPIVAQVGIVNTIRHVPHLRDMIRRTRNGEIDEPMLREWEEFGLVFGAERMIMQPSQRMGEHGLLDESANSSMLNKASQTMEVLKRAVGDVSGMSGLTIAMQRMAGLSAGHKFIKMAKAGTLNNARMRSLGLDEDSANSIQAQIRAHSGRDQTEGGRWTDTMNLKDWDPEAREAFLGAMHRWGARMVQRNIVGDLPPEMHTMVGNMAGQFRSFMLNAYQKQLMQGMNMKDFQTFMTFSFSMMFAGASYTAQQGLNSIGREDAQEFREERLSVGNLGLAAFQRAGFASLIPGAIDTILPMTPMIDEGIFSYGRSSGLATGFFAGIPTVDLANSLHSGAQGSIAAPFRDDKDFTQQDFRNVWSTLALNNVTGIRNVGNAISDELPRQSFTGTPQTLESLLGIEDLR